MRMNCEIAARYAVQCDRAGLTYGEAETLRRAALCLHGIAEQNCNGTLVRAEEGGGLTDHCGRPLVAGAVYRVGDTNGLNPLHYYPTADRETGVRRRIEAIADRIGARVEYQGDPRGWPVSLVLGNGRTVDPPPMCR